MLARSGSGVPSEPEKKANNNIIPEGPPPVKKPKIEIAVSDEKGQIANEVDIPFEGLQSFISGLNFTGCTVNFNISKWKHEMYVMIIIFLISLFFYN